MKRNVWLALLLFSTVAYAGGEEWKPAVPVRIGTVRGQISKIWIERKDNGITVRSEKVCDYEGKIPVFDVRGKEDREYYSFDQAARCTSVLNGQPVDLTISGYLSFSSRELYDGKADVKNAWLLLEVSTDRAPTPQLAHELVFSSSTRDLSARSFILDLQDGIHGDPNAPRSEESFSTSAELIDDAQ
jgi:hypothetical protein